MESTAYLNSLYELSEIIKNLSDRLRARIPQDVIDYIEENKSQNYVWNYDTTLPLDKQNISSDTEELLIAIYRDYICDDKKREQVNNILEENEKYLNGYSNETETLKEEIITPKAEKKVEVETTPIVIEEKSFFQKIFDKIKSIFKK